MKSLLRDRPEHQQLCQPSIKRSVKRRQIMYSVGTFAKDKVTTLADMPQSSVGAPCPVVIADEHHLAVAYYLEVRDEKWEGTTVRVVGPESEGEPFAIVTFKRALAYFHGPPNDEAFSGHPLSKRGLRSYGAFEVKNSSWLAHLTKMHRVHPYHKDAHYADYRHLILTFHDTTFECVAKGYEVRTGVGSLRSAMDSMVKKVN